MTVPKITPLEELLDLFAADRRAFADAVTSISAQRNTLDALQATVESEFQDHRDRLERAVASFQEETGRALSAVQAQYDGTLKDAQNKLQELSELMESQSDAVKESKLVLEKQIQAIDYHLRERLDEVTAWQAEKDMWLENSLERLIGQLDDRGRTLSETLFDDQQRLAGEVHSAHGQLSSDITSMRASLRDEVAAIKRVHLILWGGLGVAVVCSTAALVLAFLR